jgi:putative membrane protein
MHPSQHEHEIPVKPSVVKEKETHFSWLRTRMSTERTLMSWVRTSTALIGFGFTIFQFFEHFNQMPGVAPPRHANTPRTLALSLIAIGIVAVIVAIREYHGMVRYLWNDEFKEIAGIGDRPKWTPAWMVAVLLALVGLFLIGSILIRAVWSD